MTREEVRELLARLAALEADEIPDTLPLGQVAADSFALVELVLALQAETGARLDGPTLARVRTVSDLLDVVAERGGVEAPGVAP